LHHTRKPLYAPTYNIPSNSEIDKKLIVGSALFGMGWGLGGLCPGPAMALTPIATLQITVIFILAMAVGQYMATFVKERSSSSTYIERKNLVGK